jgi:opacity protein-like surface antigen
VAHKVKRSKSIVLLIKNQIFTQLTFMKKALITSVVLFIAAAGYSQHLSLNAFGGYTFGDKINFSNAQADIQAGGMWGVSLEGVNPQGTALELLYQYQKTNVPVTGYGNGNIVPSGSNSTVISYLLLNFEQYMMNNPKIQPYGGLGLGAAFYEGTESTNSATKFAWDLKVGVKFKASQSVGIKIGAQLLGCAQATGSAFYVPPYGGVYPYTTYATILQFSFTGGLCFDFGGH